MILKIGINAATFLKEKPEKRIELGKEAGFDGIEILAYPEELTQEKRANMKKILEKIGLEPMMIGCGPPMALSGGKLCLESPDESIRKNTVDYVKACADWANDFGTDKVYVVTPTAKIDVNDHVKSLEILHDSLNEACEYAKSSGIKICVENSPGKIVSEASQLNQVIRDFNIENLGALIDVGHLNMTNEDPTTAILNTDKLYHVHFDNNDGKNDLHTPLDVGTMPISNLEKAIKALKQKKYDGYYSLELLNLQNPIKTLKENIQILKEIYDRV
jgi:sugar phosphate isomerase/epimerase